MALPAAFLEELRARTPMQPLVARRVKLARSGRQWKGCCPFHAEKTPSFYVYEDGFHCFGCGAHGDAISFVMQSEGASFPEAVARLAGEAGLDVPRPTPEAAAAERRRLDLHDVLAAAAALFARRLAAPEGARARAYLAERGVSEASVAAFGLGWSGEGRGSLAELPADWATPALLAEAGLLTQDDSGPGRELFFNRVMFPIRDRQGRVIGFGGRLLGAGQPKYLNGPETPVFAKRRTLYGLDRARAAAREGQPVLVVEGYLDVIALHQAGFAGAVAPLGTALTEEHLAQIWQLSPAPVLCFDGDAAGARAAARALRLALPEVAPDRTLRVARLPAGEDPDSLVRGGGPPAATALLDGALPLDAALFELTREGSGEATPEQRAALREGLEQAARAVRHPALARELRAALLDRFFAGRRRGAARATPRPGRPQPTEAGADAQRGAILLALVLAHPWLLREEAEVVETLPLPARHAALRTALLAWAHTAESLDSAGLADHLSRSTVAADAEALTIGVDAILPAGARSGAQPAEVTETFWHYAGLVRRTSLADALAEAQRAFADRCDEASQRRLIGLRAAQARLHAEIGPGAG